jgi:hypothetical protein
VALAVEATQPLAVATLAGHSVAAFLDGDKNLRTIDLDAATPSFDPGAIDTRALVEVASGLAAAGPWLAVSKRTENLILGIDLASRAIGWSVSTPAPGPATSAGTIFQVASLGSNDALEIDSATGVVHARRDLGLFPGRPAIVGGLAACPASRCGIDELDIVTDYPSGLLVTTPTGAQAWGQDTGSGTTDPTLFGVAISQAVRWTWGDKWLSDSSSAAVMTVSGSILGMAGSSDSAWVLHGGGLTRLEAGVDLGTAPFLAEEAQGPLDLPGGRAALAWRAPGATDWEVAIVSRAQVIAGSPPASLTLARPATALFLLDGVPWVASGGTAGGVTQNAVDALQEVAGAAPRVTQHVPLDFALSQVVARSPNGQMLVQVWPGTGDIYLVRADPLAGFPLLSTISVDGRVTGFAFDESGETAYVVTRVPERLVTLE